LRQMKIEGRDRSRALAARFEWMRHRLLGVAGGTSFVDVPTAVQVQGRPVIAFRRDEEQRLLLNVAMLSTLPEARMFVVDNVWIETGDPVLLECPPSGKLVSVSYANGDALRIEFFEVPDGDALAARYQHSTLARRYFEEEDPEGFPITAVDIQMRVMREGTPVIDFDAQKTRIGGATFTGAFIRGGSVGFAIG
jgi:hypothetical protein